MTLAFLPPLLCNLPSHSGLPRALSIAWGIPSPHFLFLPHVKPHAVSFLNLFFSASVTCEFPIGLWEDWAQQLEMQLGW